MQISRPAAILNTNISGRTGRRIRLSAATLLAVVTASCVMPRSTVSQNKVLEKELGEDQALLLKYTCTVGAHRGASVEYMENTLKALTAAEENSKYAFIEFDVQYSKDNQIVVFHDNRLFRLFGSLKAINNTSFAELSEITGGEVCAYGEAMDVLRKKLNIEIKSQGDFEEDKRLADELVADIRNRKRDRDVLISSISSEVVEYIKRTYPDVRTGQVFWLTSSTYLHFDVLTEKFYEDFRAANADYLMLHVANLRNIEDLLKLKPKDKTLVFWDFDDTIYVVHKDSSDRLWGE